LTKITEAFKLFETVHLISTQWATANHRPEVVSPLVDRFVDNRLFKVNPLRPHVPAVVAMETAGGFQQH